MSRVLTSQVTDRLPIKSSNQEVGSTGAGNFGGATDSEGASAAMVSVAEEDTAIGKVMSRLFSSIIGIICVSIAANLVESHRQSCLAMPSKSARSFWIHFLAPAYTSGR